MRAGSSQGDRPVLLLGGTGFIGAHLAHHLTAAGRRVVAVDAERHFGDAPAAMVAAAARWRWAELLGGVDIVHADVLDVPAVQAVVAAHRPSAVVHLANLPLAWVAARNPALAEQAIVGATDSVLAGLEGSTARLLYVSSSMVYGDFAREPMPESGPLRPVEHYGALKARAETQVRALRPDAVVARPSAVYGPGDANRRILQKLVDADGVLAVDDPTTALDFTWVGDLAAGLAAAATVPEAAGQTFNLTRGRARTLADAAAILGVELKTDPGRLPAPRRGALDVAHARAVLGFAPTADLEDGLPALAGWTARAA